MYLVLNEHLAFVASHLRCDRRGASRSIWKFTMFQTHSDGYRSARWHQFFCTVSLAGRRFDLPEGECRVRDTSSGKVPQIVDGDERRDVLALTFGYLGRD